MSHLKKGLIFWIMLVVSVIVPSLANAQTSQTKKMLWTAQIQSNGKGVGAAQLQRTLKFTWNPVDAKWVLSSDKVTYIAQSYVCASVATTTPCTEAYATKASLAGPGITIAWDRVLCEGAACVLSDDLDITIEGDVDPAFGAQQWANLPMVVGQEGTMEIRLNDGAQGSGKFKRIF